MGRLKRIGKRYGWGIAAIAALGLGTIYVLTKFTEWTPIGQKVEYDEEAEVPVDR